MRIPPPPTSGGASVRLRRAAAQKHYFVGWSVEERQIQISRENFSLVHLMNGSTKSLRVFCLCLVMAIVRGQPHHAAGIRFLSCVPAR